MKTHPSAEPASVAIVGASGYSGEELIRLLLHHPHAALAAVTSRQYAGRTIAQVFPRFAGHPRSRQIRFSDPNPDALAAQAVYAFLALPHGVAAEHAVPLLERGAIVVDLSADFRLRDAAVYREYYGHEHPAPHLLAQAVYGLPEIHREAIAKANLIAAPGCYPTSILLPLIPLLRERLIKPAGIIADSLSGVSGAGRKAELEFLFAECNESLRAYGIPKHRHLSEIEQELSAAAGARVVIQFTPHLVPVNRGILTTIYAAPTAAFHSEAETQAVEERIADCFRRAYGSAAFVRLLEGKALPDTKNVVGTNSIEIGWRLDPRTGRLILLSAEDNIVKGASGQAVQCFNILRGLPETTGLA